MPRQGLNKESVTAAAIRLIEEKGLSSFSLNELAKSLDIKPASLYTHIQSIDGLLNEIKALAVRQMVARQMEAIEGKSRAEALFALGLCKPMADTIDQEAGPLRRRPAALT